MLIPSDRAVEENVRQEMADLGAGGAVVNWSALFAAILGREDPEVCRLVADALPCGTTVAELLAMYHDGSGDSEAGQISPRIGTRGRAGYEESTRICEALSGRGLVSLTHWVLKQFGPNERAQWPLLDVHRLVKSCLDYLEGPPEKGKPPPESPLENLTERVRASGAGVQSPYTEESSYEGFFEELCRALHRSSPRHVVLVRERGVGEHAALIELARRGLEGRPPFLGDKQVLLLDCRRVSADEVQSMVNSLFLSPGLSADAIVCMDALAGLFRAAGPWNVRSLLTSAFARAQCRVVGIMTPRESEEFILSDSELSEMFSPVVLGEPPVEVAASLVRHFAVGLQDRYRMRINEAAIHRSVVLSDSYILHERLPYKAVSLLHAACEDREYDRSQLGLTCQEVTEADVIRKVSQITSIPEATLAGVGDAVDYRESLGNLIVGQEHVIREVATEIGLIKAGMVDPGKPASVMLFVGQTGTGKTEMAKALARLYSSSKRLKTFTLGNFSEPHSVSGIIGVPPGYVGHEQGGRLVNELNSDPYGVFLLDEADKAHPDVMQPFLNLFDEGWIADQKGNKAYANRAIFILTTNVGQRQIADMCKSGKSVEEITSIMKDTLSRIRHTKSNRPVFTAEFLARVKRVIVFRSLDADAMRGICRLLMDSLQRDWPVKRQKTLVVPPELLEVISRRAFEIDDQSQGREGGRIVRKLIADVLEAPVQSAIGAAPEGYRQSRQVVVTFDPLGETDAERLSVKNIAVQFTDSHDDAARPEEAYAGRPD